MPQFDLLCIGEVNVDLILSGVRELPRCGGEVLAAGVGMHVGGCTANVATFAARLGLTAALCARVGNDDFGDFLVAELQKAGVCTDLVARDEDLATGITVSISGPEDRAFVTYLGTIDSLTAADAPAELLGSARHIHVGSYFLQRKLQPDLGAVLARARELGVTTSLDTGYDPYEQWDNGVWDVLPHVDVFMPNEVEVAALTGESDPVAGAEKLAHTVRQVALKLGGKGAVLVGTGEQHAVSAFPVEVVDTTCCGDAFNAGFLTARLAGMDDAEALRWGAAVGAIIAGGSGTSAHRLSVHAVREMLARRSGNRG
jgi:sugar/nucleoside kinase (ribokinase family)